MLKVINCKIFLEMQPSYFEMMLCTTQYH